MFVFSIKDLDRPAKPRILCSQHEAELWLKIWIEICEEDVQDQVPDPDFQSMKDTYDSGRVKAAVMDWLEFYGPACFAWCFHHEKEAETGKDYDRKRPRLRKIPEHPVNVLIAQRPECVTQRQTHLDVVLYETMGNYVVWYYSHTDLAYFMGAYFEKSPEGYEAAYHCFLTRNL